MAKKFVIVYIFLLFSRFLSTQGLSLPIEIPKNSSGMQVAYFDKTCRYRLKLTYSLNSLKDSLKTGEYSFLMAMPESNEFQKVTVIDANYRINDIKKDIYGNTVIITEPIYILTTNFLSTIFEIVVEAAKTKPPKSFLYDMKINERFNTEYNKGINIKSDLTIDAKITDKSTFNDIDLLIKKYKELVNKSDKRLDRIYDEKITNLYPIPRNKYFTHAIDLLTYLSGKKIYGRIIYGYNIPQNVEIIAKDFLIEINFLNKYYLTFDKYLNLFTNKGYFISLFSINPAEAVYDNSNYIAVIKNENVIFFKEDYQITAGCIDEKTVDARYNNLFDKKSTIAKVQSSLKDFIINESSVKSENFVLIKASENARIYDIKPVQKFSKELFLCEDIEKSEPKNPKDVFINTDSINAFIRCRSTQTNKTGYVRWIKPDGDVYAVQKFDFPGAWGYYYTKIVPNKSGWEKGIWTIELNIYGKLEIREHFQIK